MVIETKRYTRQHLIISTVAIYNLTKLNLLAFFIKIQRIALRLKCDDLFQFLM
jgi:hypothetical protein